MKWLAAVLAFSVVLIAACNVKPSSSKTSAIENDPSLVIYLGAPNGTKQDIYLASTKGATDIAMCVNKDGNVDVVGYCLPAEPVGKFVKFKDVELDTKMVLQIHAKDQTGKEIKRYVRAVSKTGAPNIAGQTANTSTSNVSSGTPIPETMNFAIKGPDGVDRKISDVFKKSYLVVELSAYDCGPCRSFAAGLNKQEQKYAPYFANGKCDEIVIVNDYGRLKGRYTQWVDMLGGPTSYLGKHSYTSQMTIDKVAKALGFSESFGIPTLLLVDRAGKVVDSANGMPKKIESLCKN